MNIDLFKPKKKADPLKSSSKLDDCDQSFIYGSLVALGKRSCIFHDSNKISNKSGLFVMQMKSGTDNIGYILPDDEKNSNFNTSSDVLPRSTTLTHEKESHNNVKHDFFQEKRTNMIRKFPSLLSLWDDPSSSACIENTETILLKPTPNHDSFQSCPLSPAFIPKFSFAQESGGRVRDPKVRFLGSRESGQVRVFAGFAQKTSQGDVQIDFHKQAYQVYDEKGNVDWLFKELVLLWHKSRQQWVQISVHGNLWTIPDPQLNICTKKLAEDSVIEDGSLLYSQGTTFLFKNLKQNENNVDFEKSLASYLSTLTCPVTLEAVPYSKLFIAVEGCTCPNSIWKLGSTKNSSSFIGRLIRKIGRHRIVERFKARPWFFSECGHVYSYHEQFKGYGLCPSCRSEGFYRPLSCVPVPELLSSKPDTAFVPCGHMMGSAEALLWKRIVAIPFEDMMEGGGCGVYWRFACPFCSSRIDYCQTLYPN